MSRDRSLDNIKLFMIFLVVFGHLIEPMIGQDLIIKTIYMSIYSFHMPVFVILSGVLTASSRDNENIGKLVQSVLIPFVTFTILYEAYTYATLGRFSNYTTNFEPYWILWFLYCLFVWRLLLPAILKFRFPITSAVILALVAGQIDQVGYFFGISRVIYFFPFFLVGYRLAPAIISRRSIKIPKIVYVVVLILTIFVFFFLSGFSHKWLYGSHAYGQLNSNGLNPVLIRFVLYCISLVASISIIMLVPAGESKLSEYGARSLYVFVWHGFFIKAMHQSGFFELASEYNKLLILFFLLAFSAAMTIVLSSKYVESFTRRSLFLPVGRVLLK